MGIIMKSKSEKIFKYLESLIAETQRIVELIRSVPIGVPIILHSNVYMPEARAAKLEKEGYIVTVLKMSSGWKRVLTKNACIVEGYNNLSFRIRLIAAEFAYYPFTQRATEKTLLMNMKYKDIITWSALDIKTNLLLMVNYEIKTHLFDELLKGETNNG
jgi:hypothetical protein